MVDVCVCVNMVWCVCGACVVCAWCVWVGMVCVVCGNGRCYGAVVDGWAVCRQGGAVTARR